LASIDRISVPHGTTTELKCLIIRQPYASLIVHGVKRWEFRGYHTSFLGRIGVAAGRGPPLKTLSSALNRISTDLPRGLVIGTGRLVSSRVCTREMLSNYSHRIIELDLLGTRLTLVDKPIGEPLEDVKAAIKNKEWRCFAWELADVTPLETPVPYAHFGRSTWGTASLT